jgi:hypothetical protein
MQNGKRAMENREWGGANCVPDPVEPTVGRPSAATAATDRTASNESAADPAAALKDGGRHGSSFRMVDAYREIERSARRALRAVRPGRRVDRDILDAVVVRAILRLSSWRGDGSLGTWVFRIAGHETARQAHAQRTGARLATVLGAL